MRREVAADSSATCFSRNVLCLSSRACNARVERRRRAQRATQAGRRESADESEISERTPQRRPDLLELLGRTLHAVQRNEQPQDLVRSLEDPIDAGVAQNPLVRKRLDEPASAAELHHLVGRAPEHLAREHLAARRLERPIRLDVRREVRELAEHRVGRVDLRRGARQLALRDLEFDDRLAELHAILGELRHLAEDLLRARGAAGGKRQTAAIEHVNGDGESLADRAEHVIRRHVQLVVVQLRLRRSADAELSDRSGDVKALHVRTDDERRRPVHLSRHVARSASARTSRSPRRDARCRSTVCGRSESSASRRRSAAPMS